MVTMRRWGLRPDPPTPYWAVYRNCGLESGLFFFLTKETKALLKKKGVQKYADCTSLLCVATTDAVSHRGSPNQNKSEPGRRRRLHAYGSNFNAVAKQLGVRSVYGWLTVT
jgi:hypothetical protein